jgi:hypothetical protein
MHEKAMHDIYQKHLVQEEYYIMIDSNGKPRGYLQLSHEKRHPYFVANVYDVKNGWQPERVVSNKLPMEDYHNYVEEITERGWKMKPFDKEEGEILNQELLLPGLKNGRYWRANP